jgi:hypothetical protein
MSLTAALPPWLAARYRSSTANHLRQRQPIHLISVDHLHSSARVKMQMTTRYHPQVNSAKERFHPLAKGLASGAVGRVRLARPSTLGPPRLKVSSEGGLPRISDRAGVQLASLYSGAVHHHCRGSASSLRPATSLFLPCVSGKTGSCQPQPVFDQTL